MFKLPFCRAGCLILMCFTSVLFAAPDSTMVLLNDLTFNIMLDRGIDYQMQADSLRRLSVELRKEAAKMDDPALRSKLQRRIVEMENSMEIYQVQANEHFEYLDASMPEEAKQEPQHPFLIRDTVLNGITVYHYNLTEEFLALLEETRQPVVDKIQTKQESGFRIFNTSPYGPDNPFEQDFPLPQGVFYRIQLGVFSKELGKDHFGGISPITTESIPERDLTRYFAGKFVHMEEAQNALVKIRALGYPDAFIIGYYDAQKGSFSKLKALEK